MAHGGNIEAQVAIIGAGPAGTAAAVHLGQLGIKDVVLVDRADFPRDKTCGSGLSPKGIDYLKKLGVWEQVEPHGYWVKGMRLVTRGDRELVVSGGDSAAAVVCNRRVLDEIILRRAESLGVKFVPNYIARDLIEEGGRIVGFKDENDRTVRARFVFVADGAHSRFVLDRGPKKMLQAIMGWWEDVSFTPNHVEMLFDPLVAPWYAWLFPESATRVNIGICYSDEGGPKKNARALFKELLEKQYATRLRGARQVGDWKGHPIVYSYEINKLHSPGRLVLGEAGRMTHPATGEGIYQAMRTGMMGAEAVQDILTGKASESAAFDRYETRCRRAFATSFWSTKAIHKVINSPVLDLVARAAAKPVVKKMAGMLMAEMM